LWYNIRHTMKKHNYLTIHSIPEGEKAFFEMKESGKMYQKFKTPSKKLTILTAHEYDQFNKPGGKRYKLKQYHDKKLLLEQNADFLGINIINICKELPFTQTVDGKWRHVLKPLWIYELIRDKKINTEYVMFCDAPDVVFLDNPEKSIDILKEYNAKLLFNCTRFRGGYACMEDKLKWSESIWGPNCYLNSGLYIGETEFLYKLLQETVKYFTPDAISKVENLQLGEGLPGNDAYCKRLPNFPLGADCQIIYRYLHDKFYPDMQLDYNNKLTMKVG